MSCHRNYFSRGHSSIYEDFCSHDLGINGFLQVFASSSNENMKMSSFKAVETFKRKRVGQTDLFQIINSLQ